MPDVFPAAVSDSRSESADASAQATRALIRDLHAAADRARDERLRLAQAQKQQQHQLEMHGGPAPVDQIVTLTDRIKQLDRVVQDRLDTLAQTQREIDIRSERINAMRHVIQTATDAFAEQVQNAQQFKVDLDAAKQAVRSCAGEVADDIRQQLAKNEAPIAARLKELVEMDRAIDKRVARMQQMHKQAAEAVDKHLLRALNNAKEQATELAAPIKAELDKHVLDRTQVLETAVQEMIAKLDVDVEEVLTPLTARFDAIVADAEQRADALAQSLPERVEGVLGSRIAQGLADLDKQAERQLSGLEADAAKRVASITRLAETSGESLAAALAKLSDQARTQADQTEQHLRRRIGELREGAQHMADLSIKQAELRSRSTPTTAAMPLAKSATSGASLDPRFVYAIDTSVPVKPVIQTPIVAESLDAFSRRVGRSQRSASHDAA
ncbi:MAG: hypothetical protein ACIAXF_11685 [Phycisphaerales bacterium JB063]